MYASRMYLAKCPTPRKEKFGKRCTKPHPVPRGGVVGHFIDTCIMRFIYVPPIDEALPIYTMCYYIASQLASSVACNTSILYPSNWYVLVALSLKAAV